MLYKRIQEKSRKEGCKVATLFFLNTTVQCSKKRSLIMSALFVLSTLPGFAQMAVEGTIRGVDKEILPSASVYCKQLDIGTTTDEKGFYSLSMPQGTYQLHFSFMGYETQEKKVKITDRPVRMNVSLKESPVSLDDVLVVGKSKARQIREQAMPVHVLQIEKISGAVNSMSDVLSKTAGITLRNSGGVGSTSRISVRGLEGKRIGIFIDGLPLSDNSEYNGLNAIPVDVIERIEVYKGIVPAKFGGSAIGGAINIVLKEYPPYYCEVKYNQASYNTHIASIGLKRNLSDKGYLIGAGGGYTYSDNNYKMELPLQKNTFVRRDHDAYEKKFGGLSFASTKWWFDEFELEAAYTSTGKEIQGIEHNIQHARQDVEVLSVSNKMDKKNFLMEGLELEINNLYSYSIFQFTDTSSYRYQWDMTPYIPVSKLGGEIGNDANATHNKSHNFIQRTNLNYIINQSHAINFNSQYNYVKGMPSDSLRDAVLGYQTHFNSDMHSWVGGLSHEYNSPHQKLANMLALKCYFYSMNTSKLKRISSPDREKLHARKYNFGISNAIRYRFSPSILAKASIAYDVRLPNEQELLGDGFLTAPATDLLPEKNKSVNLSFMYDKIGWNKRFQVELNLFLMELTDMIRFTEGMLQYQYQNFGEMRSIGTEVDVKWDATSWLYLFMNATYQDLRDIRKYEHGTTPNFTKGDRMPNIPYLMANSGFELHKANLLGRKSYSRLLFDGHFVEAYYYNFRKSNYDEPKIPRSFVFNAGLEHSMMDGAIVLGLQLNNLTNAKVLSEFNRPLPGRNYAVKIRYIWKRIG